MGRIAPPHTYKQVIQAEIANEILNTARSIIYSRIYQIEQSDPAEVNRLQQKAHEIHVLQRSFGVTDDAVIADIIATWGERIRDRERFLREF
ncbi:hypothetical protein [Bradyrhizobium brasilense]|uniref:Uncharacterized protein n=1 Tax=Bradyrhizobium brasilense TaxID=1419277 RepID=A0A1G7NK88_9BRAD|nr:hypothetical protein [Bradyrhizobium brasilense]MCC8976871.1 hypothetical protein [Bradyrhizobium brasilense]SDF74317.1 hypothetical protein SAMN05216337_10713 [Bradyrhizobium brasilense]